jgi:hypothetical protein
MNERMFAAVAEHERLANEYVDSHRSRSLGGISSNNSVTQAPKHESMDRRCTSATLQQTHLHGGCVGKTSESLMIEQRMEFVPRDTSLYAIQLASSVEPIPYCYSNVQFQPLAASQMQQQHRLSFIYNNPRSSISALSVDWETLEYLKEVDRIEDIFMDHH